MIPDLNGTYLSPARICSSIARHAVNPSLGARRRRPVGDGLEILLQILANFTSLNKNRLSKCHSSLSSLVHVGKPESLSNPVNYGDASESLIPWIIRINSRFAVGRNRRGSTVAHAHCNGHKGFQPGWIIDFLFADTASNLCWI